MELFVAATDFTGLLSHTLVAVVGSRKLTPYGRSVTYDLAYKLAERGIVIVSGLALGVDAVAHQAALDAGGKTIAVLPGSLQDIIPRSHHQLARRIVEQGGALMSEYPSGTVAYKTNFVARNRLVAGLADALLITEAAEKSGSLHTARFALEQGKDVMAVPGNITSPMSQGTNNLLKAGAMPVTGLDDILHVLHIEPSASTVRKRGSTNAEQTVLDLLQTGTTDGSELQQTSQLAVAEFNQTLTMLELSGKIRPLGANHWTTS